MDRRDAGIVGDDDGAAGVAADGVRPAGIERARLAFQTPGEEEQPRLAEQGLDEVDHEGDAGAQEHKPDGAAPGEAFGTASQAADRGDDSFVCSTADEAAEQPAEDSVANLDRHLVGGAVADADEDAEQSPADGAGPHAAAGEVENKLAQHQPNHAADGTKHGAVAA